WQAAARRTGGPDAGWRVPRLAVWALRVVVAVVRVWRLSSGLRAGRGPLVAGLQVAVPRDGKAVPARALRAGAAPVPMSRAGAASAAARWRQGVRDQRAGAVLWVRAQRFAV